MSKAKKAKMVSGVLCRDKKPPMGNGIAFALEAKRKDVDFYNGYWQTALTASGINWHSWTLKEWKEQYDLRDENNKPCPPPRKGRCFEAELEL